MELRFTKAARKHRIGRAHVRHVMATTVGTIHAMTNGTPAYRWIGNDDRGVELTILAVISFDRGTPALLVVHVQPNYRK